MILAQLSVYPIGEGTSLSRFVKKGIKVIKESGFTYEIGGMSTAIEVPDLDALFLLVKKIHQENSLFNFLNFAISHIYIFYESAA